MCQRIVHLATSHRPGDPRIFHKECRTLATAGYDVVYIVPGEADNVVDGVRVLTVSVPGSGRERMTKTVRLVHRKAKEEGSDAVIHLHDADLLGVGFRLRRAGRRVIYDSHEDTPKQMHYQHWIPSLVRPVAASLYATRERRAGQLFDGIITAEPTNALRFPQTKTITVHNYPIADELDFSNAAPYSDRQNRIAYVGALTLVRGLNEMISAVDGLPDTYCAELVLAGSFHPPSLQAEAVFATRSARYLGYLERSSIAQILAQSKIGLVVLHPVQKYLEAYPTKMFEYMAVGLPVVVSDFPSWSAIVHETGCGFVVDPLNPDAIRERIQWLLDHPAEAQAMGERGREAVRSKYNWAPEGERLLRFYERLLAGLPPGERS